MNQPVVLCGLGRVGWRVLSFLQQAGIPVVVVDTHCDPTDPRLMGARLVLGDCRRRDVLAQAGVVGARGVLILTSNDLVNISSTLSVRHLDADVRIVLRMFNDRLIPRLGKTVRNVYALSTSILTAPLFALTALTGQALSTFRLDGWTEGRRQVAEVAILATLPECGRRVAQVAADYTAVVVAHLPHGRPARFLAEVAPDALLEAGDRLVLCGEPRALAPLLRREEESMGKGPVWFSWIRRHLRALGRTLAEIDLPVKIATTVLLSVIATSTILLHYNWSRPHQVADALFRTISLLATGADMKEQDYADDPSWLKVYIASLRMVGAALTAAFTAIVTNYLLRARLGGALEVRRIPEGGHVVVCGLGNIGYRVIEELRAAGERIVVIEMARDGRFVSTTRRLGIPVIIGDATVREVLRQAHVPAARAVIACTSDDLVNLEVALLARDLNPEQRVVLRLSDPQLADMLREAASVRFALSVPELAAPAFVASLFGDRVLGVCLEEGRLLAVLNIRVSQGDANLVGWTVRAAAVNYRLTAIALTRANGDKIDRPLDERLAVGDHLVAFVSMNDIDRLLRRIEGGGLWAVELAAIPKAARASVATILGGNAPLATSLPAEIRSGLPRDQAEQLVSRLTQAGATASLRQGEPR